MKFIIIWKRKTVPEPWNPPAGYTRNAIKQGDRHGNYRL